MKNLKNITLEVSLKPFRETGREFMRQVSHTLFSQWKELCRHADTVTVMLWASDGSEILDYSGDLWAPFEWAKYIGGANRRTSWDPKQDPKALGLHTTRYPYTPNPPVFTYEILKELVSVLKETGTEATGKPVRVLETFDPGPEFAISSFKYQRHPEILKGDTMGRASFVCCYHTLHEDERAYAGFPKGIPEGTPFGTFFGRQSQRFLKDLGFDGIWFSNGLGFGSETWGTTGATFDGSRFYPEKLRETQDRILEFWELFRKECDFRVETRGTNLTLGIDLSSDGVNMKRLYEGGFDFLAPPNSPWAALDGDFGLELAGFMSRVAELPQASDFLFRFYVHDPWWMNSPWIDRYEGEPHDVYLPLALSRLDAKGKPELPNHLNLLTVDNSLGEMPASCPLEVTPHLLRAFERAPDRAGPFLWVYPFDEYSANEAGRIEKPFFEDWLIRGAINHGLPLNTVVSTRRFIELDAKGLEGCCPVTPMPTKGSRMAPLLLRFAKEGGNVLLYGSAEGADPLLLDALGIKEAAPLSGSFSLNCPTAFLEGGETVYGGYPARILHDPLLSDGGIREIPADGNFFGERILAKVTGETGEERLFALETAWGKGRLIWIRGSNGSRLTKGSHILRPFSGEEAYPQEALFRLLLPRFGWEIRFTMQTVESKNPVMLIHRHENAFYFSVYSPDTTSIAALSTPYGAPLLLGRETVLEKGRASYAFSRAESRECRVFVGQDSGVAGCREIPPVSFQARRRLEVTGLKDARVTIFPREGLEDCTTVLLNARHPYQVGESVTFKRVDRKEGTTLVACHVTGTLTISDETNEGEPEREFPDEG